VSPHHLRTASHARIRLHRPDGLDWNDPEKPIALVARGADQRNRVVNPRMAMMILQRTSVSASCQRTTDHFTPPAAAGIG